MRNLILLILLIVYSNSIAQIIQFPNSFQYDETIIPEMKIAKITDEAREIGIYENPVVFSTKEEMKALVDFDLTHVNRIYLELFEEMKENNRDDAGILVTEFHSKKNLDEVLPSLFPQSNYVFLTVDRYLILVWNDGRESDVRLRKSIEFYQKKLGAKEFIATAEHPYSSDISEAIAEVSEISPEDVPPLAIASEGMFTKMGFGSVETRLFTADEIERLQNYIVKFEQNFQTEVAIANVENPDLSGDMMKGYASHLVFNFENRIKNNIVILFDEWQNKSWVYFGVENGKILNKLPIQKFKEEFNIKLENREIYKGLEKLLMELEIGLIEASGQEAKIISNDND